MPDKKKPMIAVGFSKKKLPDGTIEYQTRTTTDTNHQTGVWLDRPGHEKNEGLTIGNALYVQFALPKPTLDTKVAMESLLEIVKAEQKNLEGDGFFNVDMTALTTVIESRINKLTPVPKAPKAPKAVKPKLTAAEEAAVRSANHDKLSEGVEKLKAVAKEGSKKKEKVAAKKG